MTEDAGAFLDRFEYALGHEPGILRDQMAASIRRKSSRLVLEAKDLCAEAVHICAGRA